MQLVLLGARVWDGTDRPAIENGLVVVTEDRVAAVGARGAVALPSGPDVRTLDFPGATIMPGLVDAHVHLIWPGDGRPNDVFTKAASDAELLLVAAKNARAALRCGVTTLRDVGSRGRIAMDLRDAITRGDAIGPRVLAAGPPITITGGHMHYLGGEADTADDVRRVARRHWRMGADFLKMVINGGGTPRTHSWIPAYSTEEIAATVAEARDHETHVTVHANSTESIRRAVAAGVNGIEHCTFMTDTGMDFAPDVVAMLAERQIAVCPTLGSLGANPPPQLMEILRMSGLTQETRKQKIAALRDAGVRLVSGTDGGINPGKPHGVLARAIADLVQGGMAPADALASATSVAADVCGLGHRKGEIQPGHDADLLIVDGDPFTDIAALTRVLTVVLNGEPFS